MEWFTELTRNNTSYDINHEVIGNFTSNEIKENATCISDRTNKIKIKVQLHFGA